MALFTGHTITPDSALGGTQIQRSLRFAGAAYNSISRTPSSTGNQKVWTWSCWFKRTKLGTGSYNYLLSSYGNNDGIAAIYFDSDDRINTYYDTSGSNPYGSVNERRYRDVGAWMHIVWQVDAINTTQKIWINGVEESLSSSLNPPNFSYTMNQSGQLQTIGGAAWYPDGTGNNNYLAEIHFSDGTKYTPSDFAYTDAQTGQWRPKNSNVIKSNITYGTNGYWLDFRDNTSTTTLGYDYSGNGNHWTLNNMSVASGIDNDSMLDSPTNNWCIWNDHTEVSDITLSEGNLKAVSGADSWPAIFGTHGASGGKWYYEAVGADNTRWGLGWSTEDFKSGTSNTFSVGHFAYSQNPLTLYQDGSNVAINGTPAFTTGQTLQVAIDIDNGKTWFGINNTWVNASNGSAGDPAAGTNPTITFSEKGQKHYPKMINNLGNVSVNFGQQGFTYTPPDGFQALNSKNLATVNAAGVVNPKRFFDTLLYTGNSTSGHSISGLEFKPDFVWIKNRDATYSHALSDTVRGITRSMNSDTTQAEVNYGNIQSVHSNGFAVGGSELVNNNGQNLVAWCWKADGAAVSNTDGTITSSVSANTEAGFSIVTYTGDGTSGKTVGHGLDVTPVISIRKARNATLDWFVHHTLVDGSMDFLRLNTTAANSNSSLSAFTSTTLPVDDNTNQYVSYCWHDVPGYSKFGSYTGNGSSDGTFVNVGFKPAWVLVKQTNAGGENWRLFDNKRSSSNKVNKHLFPSNSNGESTETGLDFLSNGFKFRDGDAHQNGNGNTYVYMAFAEEPGGTMFGLDANAR